MKATWLDRVAGWLYPPWGLRRLRARMTVDLLLRHYEGAAIGRRTQGWRRSFTDANEATRPALARLRETARDLVRNNPYAASALATIVDHTVGWGIIPAAQHEAWKRWSESREIDFEGRHDLAGLEKLVLRTTVESGEALVRRYRRRMNDGLALPLQVQVLEPDFLDTMRDGALADGGRVVQGVEFDGRGRRRAYWLFDEHPGSRSGRALFGQSKRVPASEVLHVFRADRPGQVRGVSWFAPVMLALKDFDELEDAVLMKQKVAALLSVLVTDPDGSATPLGTTTADQPEIDTLEPGGIHYLKPGQQVTPVQPPTVREYPEYARTVLRAIATGLGVGYEDLVGDYTGMPFSAARMSRLRHWARVQDWRWRILIPQFLDPLWSWGMEAAELAGLSTIPSVEWTGPSLPMIDPEAEGLAAQRNIRTGISTLYEEIRERGFDPPAFLRDMARQWQLVDELGLVLDSDARKMTQQGQRQPVEPADAGRDPDDADRGGIQGLPPGELPPQQARVLATVQGHYDATGEAASAHYVARRLGVHPSTVRKHFEALHRKGYLQAPGSPVLPAAAT